MKFEKSRFELSLSLTILYIKCERALTNAEDAGTEIRKLSKFFSQKIKLYIYFGISDNLSVPAWASPGAG